MFFFLKTCAKFRENVDLKRINHIAEKVSPGDGKLLCKINLCRLNGRAANGTCWDYPFARLGFDPFIHANWMKSGGTVAFAIFDHPSSFYHFEAYGAVMEFNFFHARNCADGLGLLLL